MKVEAGQIEKRKKTGTVWYDERKKKNEAGMDEAKKEQTYQDYISVHLTWSD